MGSRTGARSQGVRRWLHLTSLILVLSPLVFGSSLVQNGQCPCASAVAFTGTAETQLPTVHREISPRSALRLIRNTAAYAPGNFASQCPSSHQNGQCRCASGFRCSIYGHCGNTAAYCAPGNCASQCPSSPSPPSPPSTASSNNLFFPAKGMKGYNGIHWGWLPDDTNPPTSMATINGNTGKQASTYGRYSQVKSQTYDGSQLLAVKQDVINSGAVFQPAVMPYIPFNQVTPAVANQIASVIRQFTDAGVEVWLRFAHEMNYYVTQGTYHGSASEFIQAWQNVHAAVASNPKVLMFWSPNAAPSSELHQWFPGAAYVDVVGIDVYPEGGATFASVYGDFYNAFSAGYNKRFAIGETGSHLADVGSKEAWVKQLANTDVSAYPNYVACSWFEFNKGQDFRVIQGQTFATVTQTLSNFA